MSLLAAAALLFRIPTLNTNETAHPRRVSPFIQPPMGVSDMLRSLTLYTRLLLHYSSPSLSSCLDLPVWTLVSCPFPPPPAPFGAHWAPGRLRLILMCHKLCVNTLPVCRFSNSDEVINNDTHTHTQRQWTAGQLLQTSVPGSLGN